MRLRPTWPHDVTNAYPGLDGLSSIEALFSEVAARLGDRTVVVDSNQRISAAQLTGRSSRLAGGLRERGVGPGDTVCFQTPSWWETIALFRACWRLGAIASPIHHLAAVTDVDHVIRTVTPSLVLAAEGLPAASITGAIEVRGNGGFEELLVAPAVSEVSAGPADIAVVLFTSGSTGGPKGVMHTHRALVYKATTLLGIHGIDETDTVLMPAPMAHISGLSNAVMLPGAGGLTSVLMDRWSPERAIELIGSEHVTFMMGPPTFFQTMLTAANFTTAAVATLRLISCGGAGVTPSFVEAASAGFDAIVKRTYGSTEAPVVTTWHPGDPPSRRGDSDGRAAGVIEMRLAADGELQLRGPELFVGYTDAARNADSITEDGWFRTGDIATIDEDGWLRIVGRIKDIIIRGGENISAAAIESTLEAHPAVQQAVAVGYPDERLGERVCAYVVCDGPFDLTECRRWFAERGATRFTWPERIEVIDEMPVLASSGKADRAGLRARLTD